MQKVVGFESHQPLRFVEPFTRSRSRWLSIVAALDPGVRSPQGTPGKEEMSEEKVGTTKRPVIGALAAALIALGLFPMAAHAERIGPKLPQPACCWAVPSGANSGFAQVQPTRDAPFTGTITRFRVQGANGTFRLQALRPMGGDLYKAVGETGPRTAAVAQGEVARFGANLKIHSGDLIGLEVQGTAYQAFRVLRLNGAIGAEFLPAPPVGETGEIYQNNPSAFYLFNATIQP
jgi:hypothetical protein